MSLSRDEVMYALGAAATAVRKAQKAVQHACVVQLLAMAVPGTGLLPPLTLQALADVSREYRAKDECLQTVLEALEEEANQWQKEKNDESA